MGAEQAPSPTASGKGGIGQHCAPYPFQAALADDTSATAPRRAQTALDAALRVMRSRRTIPTRRWGSAPRPNRTAARRGHTSTCDRRCQQLVAAFGAHRQLPRCHTRKPATYPAGHRVTPGAAPPPSMRYGHSNPGAGPAGQGGDRARRGRIVTRPGRCILPRPRHPPL